MITTAIISFVAGAIVALIASARWAYAAMNPHL